MGSKSHELSSLKKKKNLWTWYKKMKEKRTTSPSDEAISPCSFPVWFKLPLIYLSFAFFFSYLSEAVWIFYFLIEEKFCFLAPADWKTWQGFLVLLTSSAVCSLLWALEIFYGEKKGIWWKEKSSGKSQLESVLPARLEEEEPSRSESVRRSRDAINKRTSLQQWLEFWVNYSKFLPYISKLCQITETS